MLNCIFYCKIYLIIEKFINEAEGYANNLIPKARGEAKQIVNAAEAYAEKIVLVAQGEAQRFNSVYEEYKSSKEITRQRIQLDTMLEILPKVNKVVADPQISKNFLPFLPIKELGPAISPSPAKPQ